LENSITGMIALGLVAGIIGGLFGIGGGLIMVPALILLFGMDPKTATGTSLLAQLLPVGILGVREYWRRGEMAVVPGLWIALGLLGGVLLGAMLTGLMNPATMKRSYGVFLILVGAYFLLVPQGVGPGAKADKSVVKPALPEP
jgi:uncharacterized membrane protein YfcA